jgi:hypothetical protein
MKSIRAIVAALALAVPALPPIDSLESALLAQGRASTLSQLRGIEELKSWFNSYKGHSRLIFLVSPT